MNPVAPNTGAFNVLALVAAALLLSGCHKSEAPAADAPAAKSAPAEAAEGAEEGVSLKPEEIEKMGIETTEARAITSSPEAAGFGAVIAHETIAQAVAELRTAIAAERQSHSALERSKRLAGTPGAMPADTQEAAERQSAADQAALELARQRLTSTFGQNPPWKDADGSAELHSLASGQTKLVRVTYPLGSIDGVTPHSVRLSHIGPTQIGRTWQSNLVWAAPADSTVPGRSFFAILKSGEVSEGDHLMAWAPVGEPEPGVLVPASAALVSAGKFWCYIEKDTGTFVRTEFDPGRPTPEGYFVNEGIPVGAKVVTSAAGQLLARETNPSAEPE